MDPNDLAKSWKRTEGFLLDARSHLSEAAEAICSDQIAAFEEYLQHNELELALDELEEAREASRLESWHMLELMAFAAASMGLFDRQRQYDAELTRVRGWKYATVLPPLD